MVSASINVAHSADSSLKSSSKSDRAREQLAEVLRGIGAGFFAVGNSNSKVSSTVAEPVGDAALAATELLKSATKNVPYLNRVTDLAHTGAALGVNVLVGNVTNGFSTPGDVIYDIGSKVADVIDGKDTFRGWSLGWGARTPEFHSTRKATAATTTRSESGSGEASATKKPSPAPVDPFGKLGML